MFTFLRSTWQRAACALLLALLPLAASAGFSVSNGQLVDANGVPFVMRGMSYPYAWYTGRGDAAIQQDLTQIAATKANTVRFVLSSGAQWTRVSGTQVSQLIQWARARSLVAVLEVHDTTGWSESAGAVPISSAVAYWTSADIRAAINGQENFVVINIANEPFGNTTSARFVPDTIAAVQALRNAGLTHTLMVDAADWGQDWTNTLRSNATQIWNADVLRNLVFSVHMYEVYGQASTITAYMQAFDDMNLPLVIGEFGPVHNGQNVDEDTIMAQAQQRGNGYLAWSWSGNGSCCTALDMVSNFGTTLTTWGQRVVNGANGFASTSVPATVFGTAAASLAVSATSVSMVATASSATVTVTANTTWTVTDNQSWLTVSPASGSGNGSFAVSATANTGTAARSGTVTVTGGGLTRTITVSQAAPGTSTLTLSASTLSMAATAATASVTLTGNVAWTATDNQSWLTVSPASGSGNGTLTVSATANTGTAARSGTVTVTGGGLTRTVAVSQAAPAAAGTTCANAITFTGNTGNVNSTAAACYRTNATVNGWGCYNFDGRTVTVGGVARTCGQLPITRSADGYYYFQISAGTSPWAGISIW